MIQIKLPNASDVDCTQLLPCSQFSIATPSLLSRMLLPSRYAFS